MSLEIWLARGREVRIGGRKLRLMPLPLSRLHVVGNWLNENCREVVRDLIATQTTQTPDPFAMITQVLLRVDVAEVAYQLFSTSKDPETGKPINEGLTKEFFEEYLDVPAAHELFKIFIEVNEVPDLLKNLQRLPMVQALTEISMTTLGLPYLSSLRLSTASTQRKSEGSQSLKSTDSLEGATTGTPETGNSNLSLKELEEKQQRKPLLQ